MGKESVQIKRHIEDERAKLDRNLASLEHRFTEARDTFLRWWRSPELMVGLAFTAGLMLADFVRESRSRSCGDVL